MISPSIKWNALIEDCAENVIQARQALAKLTKELARAREEHWHLVGEEDYVEDQHPTREAKREVRAEYKSTRSKLRLTINEMKKARMLAQKWVAIAEAQLAAEVAKGGVTWTDPAKAPVVKTITITGGVVTGIK